MLECQSSIAILAPDPSLRSCRSQEAIAMAPVIVFLTPTWETWIQFLALVLTWPQPWQAFEEQQIYRQKLLAHESSLFLALSPHLCTKKKKSSK